MMYLGHEIQKTISGDLSFSGQSLPPVTTTAEMEKERSEIKRQLDQRAKSKP